MPLIDHIDGANRDIYLSADTVGASIHPVDIYKEMRVLRRTNESLRKFNLFLEAKGKDPKGSGKFTERFVRCLEGTRIVPYDTSHDLTVTGTIITDDGQEGIACFDRSPLAPTTTVNINYFPPQVEIIEVAVGGSSLTAQEVADAVWNKVLEAGLSAGKLVKLMASVLAGKVSGAGTGTETFKGLDGVTDRVVVDVDDSGNRSSVTVDGS